MVDKMNLMFGNLQLWVSFTTSGNNNTGAVTRADAYVLRDGFTYATTWDETYLDCHITQSGKDVFAEVAGQLSTHVLVEGVGEILTEAVHMDGYAYVIR